MPPIRPRYLPTPYTWKVYNEAQDPNNPYNLIDAAREVRELQGKRPGTEAASETVAIMDGFPEQTSGRLVLVPQDNLNTDGIYGKDYTYKDDMTGDDMARVLPANSGS